MTSDAAGSLRAADPTRISDPTRSAEGPKRAAEEPLRTVRMKLLGDNAEAPARGTDGSVGYDIKACLREPVEVPPGRTALIGSGFAIELGRGYAALVFARSGLGINHGMVPANCVGVIDSDYRGEVKIGLKNTSDVPFVVNPGDRIAQMVIVRCELPEIEICDSIESTARGAKGFGSSGVGREGREGREGP